MNKAVRFRLFAVRLASNDLPTGGVKMPRVSANSATLFLAHALLILLTLGSTGCLAHRGNDPFGEGTGCDNVNPTRTPILTPDNALPGTNGLTITVTTVQQVKFNSTAQVLWNDSTISTTAVDAKTLRAQVPANLLANMGKASVKVGEACASSQFDHFTGEAIFSIDQGPTITSLSPPSIGAGAPFLDLTVNGTGFVNFVDDNHPGSLVFWNGPYPGGKSFNRFLITRFVSSTQVIAEVTNTELASAGTAQVTVMNPTWSDQSGTSAPAVFTINSSTNPVPTIAALSPSSAVSGSAAFTLTVDGLNFLSTSVVQWNGSPRPTTVITGTELTAAISAADVAAVGTASVTVVNPAPGGGASDAAAFDITASKAGVLSIISMNNAGDAANGINNTVSLSANGRYAAFASPATTNLVSNPPVSQSDDVYYHDSCIGVPDCSQTTQLASVKNGSPGTGGNDGDGPSYASGTMSGDGRFVAFTSVATNLALPKIALFQQAYIRDTCTGVVSLCTPSTSMVSLVWDGNEPNFASYEVAISSQARYVAFTSEGTNLLPGVIVQGQAYLRDTCQGLVSGCIPSTTLVSADSHGNSANNAAAGIAISANGRFVSFSSRASNLPGALGNGAHEVYVRDTCLNAPDCSPSTTMVSVDNSGQAAPTGDAGITSISEDGRIVGFISSDPLAPNDAPGWNLYLRDTCQTESGPVTGCTPSTITASVASDGSAGNAGLVDNAFNTHVISGTGRFAIFNSRATNLVPGGTPANGIFVRDTCIGATGCTPSTVLVSVDSSGNFVLAGNGVISSDGHYSAFIGQVAGVHSVQAVLAVTSF